MKQLTVWLDEKLEFIEDRLNSLEDSYADIGDSMYRRDPDEVQRLITEDSDTYIINELYKLANGDVQELAKQLTRESFGCAVSYSFLMSLMSHVYYMLDADEQEKRQVIEQKMMDKATKKTYDCEYTLDNEHY